MKKSYLFISFISAIIGSLLTTIAVFALSPAILSPFPDVGDNAYYADGVYKLRSRGIVSGYENGNFGPEDPVTRGQLAVMLDKYDRFIIPPEPMPRNSVWHLAYLVCEQLRESGEGQTNENLQSSYSEICAPLFEPQA